MYNVFIQRYTIRFVQFIRENELKKKEREREKRKEINFDFLYVNVKEEDS